MVQMVLIYCMIGQPSLCTEQRPMFEQPLSMMGCMISAQQTAATYVQEHPAWTLSRFRCEQDRPREARI